MNNHEDLNNQLDNAFEEPDKQQENAFEEPDEQQDNILEEPDEQQENDLDVPDVQLGDILEEFYVQVDNVLEESEEQLHNELVSIYEQMMMLTKWKNVTPGAAIAWYALIMRKTIKTRITMFSGYVSEVAIKAVVDRGITTDLVLEHYRRLHTEITKLIQEHKRKNILDSNAFVDLIHELESVHITTATENRLLTRNNINGDYALAQINLIHWNDIEEDNIRNIIWYGKLNGHIKNANDFNDFNN